MIVETATFDRDRFVVFLLLVLFAVPRAIESIEQDLFPVDFVFLGRLLRFRRCGLGEIGLVGFSLVLTFLIRFLIRPPLPTSICNG